MHWRIYCTGAEVKASSRVLLVGNGARGIGACGDSDGGRARGAGAGDIEALGLGEMLPYWLSALALPPAVPVP